MLAMGTSLRVTPAADIVQEAGNKFGAKLVIINLQKTPMYDIADLNIHGFMDDVMKIVM